jgi:predicted SprT family Zn-dependent metalloprotease
MIHVANWLLDGTAAETKHHGPDFKKWADVVHRRVSGVEITTYHSYDIHKSHHFECTGADCGAKFMRHSKKGLDITK